MSVHFRLLTVSLPVILVGDASVGKTHLLSRYVRNSLPKSPTGTIGIEFATHLVKLQDGASVKAQLWDTGASKVMCVIAYVYIFSWPRKISLNNCGTLQESSWSPFGLRCDKESIFPERRQSESFLSILRTTNDGFL